MTDFGRKALYFSLKPSPRPAVIRLERANRVTGAASVNVGREPTRSVGRPRQSDRSEVRRRRHPSRRPARALASRQSGLGRRAPR